jgi:hypothetical protein
MRAPLRPAIEIEVRESSERLLDRTARRLRAPDCPLCGVVAPDRIELHVPPSRQHLWSPELRIDVRGQGDTCRLYGVYGPHPHVWMLFAGVYGALAFGAFVALVFAIAQWTLGQPPSALYALTVLSLLAFLARSLAYVGQGFAGDQMDELAAFLEDLIARGEAAESVPRRSGIRSAPEARAARELPEEESLDRPLGTKESGGGGHAA